MILNRLFGAVALLASEADWLAGAGEDGAALRCAGDVDPPAAPELQQPLLAEEAE